MNVVEVPVPLTFTVRIYNDSLASHGVTPEALRAELYRYAQDYEDGRMALAVEVTQHFVEEMVQGTIQYLVRKARYPRKTSTAHMARIMQSISWGVRQDNDDDRVTEEEYSI